MGNAYACLQEARLTRVSGVASGGVANPGSASAGSKTALPGGTLNPLMTIMQQGINQIGSDEWQQIEMTVDSGASETVIGEDMIESAELKEGRASRKGTVYEVANGVRTPNRGEKSFIGTIEEWISRAITAQVCDVNKGLLSVRRMVDAGNRVALTKHGSYIEDPVTGEFMNLEERYGMYILRLWTKRPKGTF